MVATSVIWLLHSACVTFEHARVTCRCVAACDGLVLWLCAVVSLALLNRVHAAQLHSMFLH